MKKNVITIELPEGITTEDAIENMAVSLGYRIKVQTKTESGQAVIIDNPLSPDQHVTQALSKFALDHYARGYKTRAAMKAADEAQKEIDVKLGKK